MIPKESPLKFPCAFPIKALGKAEPGFRAHVVGLVRVHAPDLDERWVTSRPSRQGRYVSVTLLVNAKSRAQLDAIYRSLSACEQVVIAL
jgi:putative lipoic acid-binding regulatory protein